MNPEEAARYAALTTHYNLLAAENARLRSAIENAGAECRQAEQEINRIANEATREVSVVGERIGAVDDTVRELNLVLSNITENYFLFKNLSEASKLLTQYNDIYFTKFKYYHDLRRITLGYVIGVDSHIVSSESLRKKVEKAYLANTNYWLSYAISAVMLWASDEKEAAYRALNKAMTMDCYKSSVFFMLVNLRFTRVDAARSWYLSLLEKTDVNNVSPEWQYILHAYLTGVLRTDEAFMNTVSGCFEKMLEQTEATSANFSGTVIQAARNEAANLVHVTEQDYPLLRECCSEYADMKLMLSDMEKIGRLCAHYSEAYQMQEDSAETIFEQIENILYDLINGYDEEEFKVVQEIRRNEAVIAARGDSALANQRFQAKYAERSDKTTFGDLLIRWAFADDYKETDITVKRFALSRLKDRIVKGLRSYFEERRSAVKEQFPLSIYVCSEIGSYSTECDENAYPTESEKLTEFCNRKKYQYIFADKYLQIFLIMCGAALLLIGIASLIVNTAAFSVFLTLGLVLGIVSGFLVWRRWVDKRNELLEHIRRASVRLHSTLDEMADWRKRVESEYAALDDLERAVDMF